jgi:hypothetical protein
VSLKGLEPEALAQKAAHFLAVLNAIHPGGQSSLGYCHYSRVMLRRPIPNARESSAPQSRGELA